MDEIEIALSVIGSVVGLAGLWYTSIGWGKRFIQFVSVCVIGAVVYYAASYRAEVNRLQSIERQAAQILKDRRSKYTSEGFILASLAFLEKHNSDFPETYRMAKDICKNNGCFESSNKRNDSLEHKWDQISVASQMAGALRGIASLSGD